MINRIDVAIDCRDLTRMVQFWTALLGYDHVGYDHGEPMDDRYWAATHPHGAGPRLVFQTVNDAPSGSKSPIHIDLHVNDIDEAAATVIEWGGSRLDAAPIVEAGSAWLRCLDPEGNVLCLVQVAG
jgi:predicted enzyme related to lactoylglutathione lyase